jgi:AbiV family abortive infection protein
MYRKCSDECLENANSLLEAAKTLLKRKKYAIAQSLSITALEEVGKSIILELVELGVFDSGIADKAINKHKHKRAIMLGFKKGLVIPDLSNPDKKNEYFIGYVDQSRLKLIGEKILNELDLLDEKRENGLYVEVDFDSGKIKSSPKDCVESEALIALKDSSDFLTLGKILIKKFRSITKEANEEGTTVNNFSISQEDIDYFFNFWNNAELLDKTLSIGYDEA